MMRLLILGLFCLALYSDGRPNGSPQDACFYMTPRHIHPHTFRKVFPTKAMGLYNITTSADVFRPDRPIRITLWGPPFKGFMMVAAEEGAKDWPTGIFYSEDGSAKRLSCLGRGDTVTHQNNSYKDSVSVLWYGPENMMSEQIQFIATVVVNLTIYYTNIKSGFLRLDPTLHAPAGADGAVGGAVTMDPWLAGETATRSPWWSQGGGGGAGGARGGSSAWGLSALLGGGSQQSSASGWGSRSNSGWGSNSNTWGSGQGSSGSSSGNWWQGSGSGSGSGNTWGSGGWQQRGQPSGGNTWGSGNSGNSWGGSGGNSGNSWGGSGGNSWGSGGNSGNSWGGSGGNSGNTWGSGSGGNGWGAGSGNSGNNWGGSNGNSWGNSSAWQQQGVPQNYQPTSAPPPAEAAAAKKQAEVWSWNWNSKSEAAPGPVTTPAATTPPPPAPRAEPGPNTGAWSDNSLQSQSTNVWAKLLDYVLQQSTNPQTPAV